MASHSGCFVCGKGRDEILTSIPDWRTTSSVAICHDCYSLSSQELRKRIDNIRTAMEKAREAAANG